MSSAAELIIGVGNRWRGDDAAGLEVAARVPGAVSAEGEPVALLDLWQGASAVTVVDAVSSGAAPGTIHRLDASDAPLPAALAGPSTHLLGLSEAIELARALGRLPARVTVYGIEGEDFSAGAGLTPAVLDACAALADSLRT
jgi:hydrogenase maturation protease